MQAMKKTRPEYYDFDYDVGDGQLMYMDDVESSAKFGSFPAVPGGKINSRDDDYSGQRARVCLCVCVCVCGCARARAGMCVC